ncbi:MAG: PaaI family thioesterase [Pseudomonadota bacterium]
MAEFTPEDGEALLKQVFAPWVQAQKLTPTAFGEKQARFVLPEASETELQGGPGAGFVCGQAIASACDTAVVLALSGANGRFRNCTTVDLHVNYLRPLPKGNNEVVVDIESNGRKLAIARVSVFAEGSEKPSAIATATFMYLEA